MKYYALDKEYVTWLKQFDRKIEDIDYGINFKPYIGVALEITGLKYFIPLSSNKPKYKKLKDDIDFLKITNLKDKKDSDYHIFGALNINNMIPVPDSQIEYLDMDNLQKYKQFDSNKDKYDYRMLLENEYLWIKKNIKLIQTNASKLHYKITTNPEKNKFLVDRCCKWKLLEKKCNEYEISKQQNEKLSSEQVSATKNGQASD